MCEITVPIKMHSLKITDNDGQTICMQDAEFFNILVLSCPRYVRTGPNRYAREHAIMRERYAKVDNWPLHPMNGYRHILGAIIIIVSQNRRLLLVRNAKLWGLPKGARNYRQFLTMKRLTDNVYEESRCILVHGDVIICPDDAESPVENICRETLEETGIKLDAKRLMDLGVDDPCHSGYNRFYYRYECDSEDYWSTLSQARVDHENDELVWVSMDELDDMLERHEKSKLFNHVSYLFLRAFRSGEHPLE